MAEYHMIWEIDITADTPREAAEKCLEIQRDTSPESMAKVFDVYEMDPHDDAAFAAWHADGEFTRIDLDEDPEPARETPREWRQCKACFNEADPGSDYCVAHKLEVL